MRTTAVRDGDWVTLDCVKSRQASGSVVWDFQGTRFKPAHAKAAAVAVRALVGHHVGRHLHRRLTVQEALIAKLYAPETLCRHPDDMVSRHDGHGFMFEYPIVRIFVDYRVSRVVDGANEVMRELIARKL